MLEGVALVSFLAVAVQPAGPQPSHTPEQLAVGAIREIISAQAVHKKGHPQLGYACSLQRLVETQMLADVWLAGKRVEGYAFYRASGVPVKKAPGSSSTVCADESTIPRTVDGDVAACFARGAQAGK